MQSASTANVSTLNRSLEWFGDLGTFSWNVVRASVTKPFEFREIFRQLDEIGSKSLPLVACAGAAVGAVLALAGDAQKDLVLTEARASVVRNYLVENFGFDDVQLKTLGLGKKTGADGASGWGAVDIVVFPPGTDVPTN
jgi:hypothetical protein